MHSREFQLVTAGFVAVLVAGCFGSGDIRIPPTVAFPFAFECFEGTYRPRPDVCAMPLGAPGAQWGEPNLAADPTRASVFALAVQGGAAPRQEPAVPTPGPLPDLFPTTQPTPEPCGTLGMCLFVTQDGGRTWSARNPNSDERPLLVGDSTLSFAGSTLYVGGLTWADGKTRGIAVLTTKDLGESWQLAHEIVSATADRPWLGAHGSEALLVWQTLGKTEGFWAASVDGGRSWSEPSMLPCNLFSQPTWTDAGWFFVCGARDGARVYHWDGEADQLATLRAGTGTLNLAAAPDGSLWYARPGAPPTAYRSTDGGESWDGPFDLTAAIPASFEVRRSFLSGMTSTAGGDLLALSFLNDDQCVLRCEPSKAPQGHLLYVAKNGDGAAEVQLTPTTAERPWSGPDSVPRGEFESIACHVECVAAWMVGAAVDVGVLTGSEGRR